MTQDSARTARPARSSTRRDGKQVAGLIVLALVAGLAATASYIHMEELAFRHGQGWLSYLYPLSVDGMILSASLVIVSNDRNTRGKPVLAWMALFGGVLASLAANVASALPDPTSRLIAASTPIAFAVAFEMTLRVIRPATGAPGEDLDAPGDDDLFERALELVEQGMADGVKVGRGTLEKELGLSEYQARRLLHQVRQVLHQPLQAVGDES